MTPTDQQLLHCIADKVSRLSALIAEGRPYVWQLRLSADEFKSLEQCLKASVAAHGGDHRHLLAPDFALPLVIYLAEWYKREYNGSETGDSAPVVALTSDERKQLWEASGIDSNIFVYNASSNPDKPSRRWQESLQVLGGLAVKHELRRSESDPFLSKLCRIFHGEDIDIGDIEDRGRAVAFQQSIAQRHSLYEYVAAVLDGDYPFHESDLRDNGSLCNQLIRRLQGADRMARKDKFEFEWLISYYGYRNVIARQLRLRLKPEEIGGGLRQYLGYDRLRDFWDIESPETIGTLLFSLRFKNGSKMVQAANFGQPLLVYLNTRSEQGGFVLHGSPDEIICKDVPLEPFTTVELVLKYDGHEKLVQSLECAESFVQVYRVAGSEGCWTSRTRPQAHTAVVFDDSYRLKDDQMNEQVRRLHLASGKELGREVNWCPIYDQVTLLDERDKEYHFFNRNGFYQVMARQYMNTIKYQDSLYVTYKYVDLDESELDDLEDDDYLTDMLPVLFGREGLQVRYYPNRNSTDWKPVESYELEYKQADGTYIDWKVLPPQQGRLQLRITIKGITYLFKVYYVPFVSSADAPQPIWRDFDHKKICFGIADKEDITDTFEPNGTEDDTLSVSLGTRSKHILVDVYRPVLLKELFQNGQLVGSYGEGDAIDLPLLLTEQFKIRHFNRDGVETHDCNVLQGQYYPFSDFHTPRPNAQLFTEKKEAKKLANDFGVNDVNVYLTTSGTPQSDRYAWDYNGEPEKVENEVPKLSRGLVFQSLIDEPSPRHYYTPQFVKENIFAKKSSTAALDLLHVFLTIAWHKVYFFLFEPMRKVAKDGTMIQDIVLPLIAKREGNLTDDDLAALYRFAAEFHFDWMLLPREKWQTAIASIAHDEEENEKLKIIVTDFFSKTPKCTHEQERIALKDMLNRYWSFNRHTASEPVAVKAIKMILGDQDCLSRNETWEEFLKAYDTCRYKFVEMSKILNVEN